MTDFETIKMEEDESFDAFHSRLKDIVNSLYNLGESLSESKIVKKILRSLPDRFLPKITAIEESKNLDTLSENESIGSLQTFESNRLSKHKTRKVEQTVALRAREESKSESDSSSKSDFEEVANFARNFNKFMKLSQKPGGNSQGQGSRQTGKGYSGNKSQQGENCFECDGRGHRAFECPTRIRREEQEAKHKALNVSTLSDDEGEPNTQQKESHDYLALAASVSLEGENKTFSDNDSHSDEEEDFSDLQSAYDALLKECEKLYVENSKLASKSQFFEKELNVLKLERASFEESKAEKIDLLKRISVFEDQKTKFIAIIDSLKKDHLEYEEKIKRLEGYIFELTQKLENSLSIKVGLEDSSKKLENMLLNQKSSNNKEGLGFSNFDPQKTTKPVFVKATTQKSSFDGASTSKSKVFIERTPQTPKVFKNTNKGKQVFKPKPSFQNVSHLEVLDDQVIPFDVYKATLPQPFWCEYCNKSGHLREFCWQALKHMPKSVPVPKPKPKSRGKKKKNKIERVKVLLGESKRIINELKSLGFDNDSSVGQKGHKDI